MRGMFKLGMAWLWVVTPATMVLAADEAKPILSMTFNADSTPAGAQTQPAGTPKIRCDQPMFEFAEIWAGEKVQHTFVLHNDGDAVLLIPSSYGVQVACGCTVLGKCDERIEPGQEGRIPLVFNSRPNQRGPVEKKIVINSNDPITPKLTLTLKGNVKTAIDMQPASGANWGRYTAASPDTMTIKIRNELAEPWKLVYQPGPANVQQNAFDIVLNEIEKGKAAEALVILRKPIKQGSAITQFKLTTGLKQQPELVIKASVFVPPAPVDAPSTVVAQPFLYMGVPAIKQP